MTSELIQKMKDTETLELTKGQLFWHYSVLLLILIVPALTTIDVFKYYVTHTYKAVRPIEEMMSTGYIPIIPAILFYYIQKRRLKFRTVIISVDAATFQKAAERTGKELEWHFLRKTTTIIVARSGFSWRSWGELITIIRDKDRILINSICDPDNRPSVASWGMNKINIKTFEQFVRKDSALQCILCKAV